MWEGKFKGKFAEKIVGEIFLKKNCQGGILNDYLSMEVISPSLFLSLWK